MKCSQAIDVICQHCRDGSIIPIKIRVQDDEQINNVYIIQSFKALDNNELRLPSEVVVTSNILRYDCKIEVFGTLKRIVLHYNKSQVKWYVHF